MDSCTTHCKPSVKLPKMRKVSNAVNSRVNTLLKKRECINQTPQVLSNWNCLLSSYILKFTDNKIMKGLDTELYSKSYVYDLHILYVVLNLLGLIPVWGSVINLLMIYILYHNNEECKPDVPTARCMMTICFIHNVSWTSVLSTSSCLLLKGEGDWEVPRSSERSVRCPHELLSDLRGAVISSSRPLRAESGCEARTAGGEPELRYQYLRKDWDQFP